MFGGTFHWAVNRPRIDFDIVNVMEPMTIAGTNAPFPVSL